MENWWVLDYRMRKETFAKRAILTSVCVCVSTLAGNRWLVSNYFYPKKNIEVDEKNIFVSQKSFQQESPHQIKSQKEKVVFIFTLAFYALSLPIATFFFLTFDSLPFPLDIIVDLNTVNDKWKRQTVKYPRKKEWKNQQYNVDWLCWVI